MRRVGNLFGILSATTCLLAAQIAAVRPSGERIIVTDTSGRNLEILDPEMDSQSVRISPDASRLIYHMKFLYPDPSSPLRVKIWSPASDPKYEEIRVPLGGRFVERVEWLGNRDVLFAGDSHAVIVDTESRRGTHRLWARRLASAAFFVSPDGQKIIYSRGVPRTTPPELQSDVAMLAVVGQGLTPAQEPRGMEAGVRRIYPPDDDPNSKGTPAEIPEKRHAFMSGFLWFSDSSRTALVEGHEGAVWLVVLTFGTSGASISARPERFVLDLPFGKVDEFSWLTPDSELVLAIDGHRIAVKPLQRSTRYLGAP